MNSSSKKQQSFSSYSDDKGNEIEKSEDGGFSEYEEDTIKQRSFRRDIDKNTPQNRAASKQRRRYSYGGAADEKRMPYNYLDSFNYPPIPQSTAYYTASLKHSRQPKFILGAGSPCGLGTFDNTSLLQYEQCYLSGLNKYYKSHNYNKKPQKNNLSVESSANQKRFNQKSLERSQYWNGQKFDYLKQNVAKQKKDNLHKQKYHINKQRENAPKQMKDNNQKVQFERNVTSGLIVNKKSLKQTKTNPALKPTSKQDTSTYIKIQQDFSNSKNYSEAKKTMLERPIDHVKIDREALIQKPLKHNTVLVTEPKQSASKFSSIQIKPKASALMQKQYSSLLAEKNELCNQNTLLKQLLKKKDQQLESLAHQKIVDNNEYTQKIQKLKQIFQAERQQLVRQFETELDIYKSVRKEAIKSELVKEQAERVALGNEKAKLQSQLKKVSAQMATLQRQLAQKNQTITSITEKMLSLQLQLERKSENRIETQKSQEQNQKQNIKNDSKKSLHTAKSMKQQLPQWVTNFLTVFKNMVHKLIGQIDPKWSDKKVIIIGWKVVKIIIEKAVKLGIKIPQVVNDTEIRDCSLLQPNDCGQKKYHLVGSKKPIRV